MCKTQSTSDEPHDVLRKLHHVGFVLADIEAGIAGFVKSLAARWEGRIYEDPYQQVKVTFLTTRVGDAQIELVAPIGDTSPVAQFLHKTGGGMHHVCFEVADLAESMTELRKRGAIIAKRPKPAVAFGGRKIAWILTAEKMLIELLQQNERTQC
jgi:methylmalonyl-CoA/ethylmalonyl-CoA epimerase